MKTFGRYEQYGNFDGSRSWAIYLWNLQQQQAAEAEKKKKEEERKKKEAEEKAAAAAAAAKEKKVIKKKIDEKADIKNKQAALLAALKKKRLARQKALRAKHAAQAAYGRDVRQIRPKHAGYATESERIMGGSTGYYKRLQGLGDVTDEVNRVSSEVEKLTKLVKKVAADVKKGTAPKSELTKLVLELEEKTAYMKKISRKSLSGFGEKKSSFALSKILFLIIGTSVIGWFMLNSKNKAEEREGS